MYTFAKASVYTLTSNSPQACRPKLAERRYCDWRQEFFTNIFYFCFQKWGSLPPPRSYAAHPARIFGSKNGRFLSVQQVDKIENNYNISAGVYVEQKNTREIVDITELNVHIAQIVKHLAELRTHIVAIVADLEGA